LPLLADDRSSVLLLGGPAGIGKTALATAIVRAATAAGRRTHRVTATATATVVPFGALAEFIPDSGGVAHGDIGAAVGRMIEEADESADRRRVVLFVDDLPMLDPSSSAVIARLVREQKVNLIATARSKMPLPTAFVGLEVEGLVVRHVVEPLSRDRLAESAEAVLGGPLAPEARAVLWNASQGVPLHARELLQVNLAAGHLVVDAAEWRFDTAPIVPPSLIELVSSRFGSLTVDHSSAFESIALAQPVPLDAALRMASGDVLADLERAELIIVSGTDTEPEVRLGHPLYGEVAEQQSGRLQRREAARRAVAALESGAVSTSELGFRASCLRLEHRLPLRPDQAIAAARRALNLVDPVLAERLARSAGDGFEAQFILGAALIAQGRTDEADATLHAAMQWADSDADRARVISRRGNNLAAGAGRFGDAVAVLESGMNTIEDPRWRSFLAADLAYARLWIGEVHASTGEIDPVGEIGAAGHKPAAVRANECLIGAVVAVMGGELKLAESLVVEGLPLVSAIRDDVPTARDLLTLSRFLALAFAGDAAGADQLVATELERSSDRAEAAPGMWFAVRAFQQLMHGDFSAALTNAASAERLLSAVDISGLHPLSQAVRACALAQSGDVAASVAVVDAIDSTWRDEPKVRALLGIARSWRLVHAGEPSRAASALVSVGRGAVAANHLPFGGFAAHDAVRLGFARQALPLLAELADTWEGPLSSALLSHATALSNKSPTDLLAVARQLPTLGFTLSGAEAAMRAAHLFELSGCIAEARHAEYVAAGMVRPLGQSRSAALGHPRGLTTRETEIARRAASRQSSRQIAESLGISTRTVDNHLTAVYQKVGVSTRRALSHRVDLAGIVTTGEQR